MIARPAPWRLLPIVGIAAACATRNPMDRQFDENRAVRVEVTDDAILVDGKPATLDNLPKAFAEAWQARGSEARPSALVLIRYAQREGENVLAFEQRKQTRTQDVVDTLTTAGVKDLHLGPLAKNQTEEERTGK